MTRYQKQLLTHLEYLEQRHAKFIALRIMDNERFERTYKGAFAILTTEIRRLKSVLIRMKRREQQVAARQRKGER